MTSTSFLHATLHWVVEYGYCLRSMISGSLAGCLFIRFAVQAIVPLCRPLSPRKHIGSHAICARIVFGHKYSFEPLYSGFFVWLTSRAFTHFQASQNFCYSPEFEPVFKFELVLAVCVCAQHAFARQSIQVGHCRDYLCICAVCIGPMHGCYR